MKLYRIRTRDQRRRSLWYGRFGVESLPVKNPMPREQELPGGTVLAFDLDASRLSAMVVDAFGHLLEKERQTSFSTALKMIDSYPIPAEGCTVVLEERPEPAAWQAQPFVFASGAGSYL